jgi:hypothetical protein
MVRPTVRITIGNHPPRRPPWILDIYTRPIFGVALGLRDNRGVSGGAWRAPPGWRKKRERVFARYGRRCWRCGGYATTVDHVVPVVLGGSHDLPNLRPACQRCNCSAGASIGNRLRRGVRPPVPMTTSRNW